MRSQDVSDYPSNCGIQQEGRAKGEAKSRPRKGYTAANDGKLSLR